MQEGNTATITVTNTSDIEGYGFAKEVDWIELQLRAPEVINEKLLKVGNMMLKRYDLRLYQAKSIK